MYENRFKDTRYEITYDNGQSVWVLESNPLALANASFFGELLLELHVCGYLDGRVRVYYFSPPFSFSF